MLTCFLSASAQNIVKPVIKLHGNTEVYNAVNPQTWLEDNSSLKLPASVLLKFKQLPTQSQKNLLNREGVILLNYLSDNTYTAIINSMPNVSLLNNTGVILMANMLPEWKIDRELKKLNIVYGEMTSLTVLFSDVAKKEEILEYLQKLGATIISDRLQIMKYAHVQVPSENIMSLSQWYNVMYVSAYQEDQPLNSFSKAVTRMQIASAPISRGGYALKGEGVTIAVGDNTSGIFHVDLSDRTINYNPQGYTNHGVHINGIVGGAGIIDPRGEGMAPAAMLTNHFFSDVLVATPEIAAKHGVVATNNSYTASLGSCGTAGTYDILSAGLDALCNAEKNVLQVFAAANDGLMNCSPFPNGFATIAAGYQPAKNNIVVASTDKEYVNADNSSKGPVKDGRLKPEITAVGVDVNSSTRNEEYLVASGTSMACPQVAGAAALLTQRMRQLGLPQSPQSDVLKTLLINGATDIGIPGPDFRFGFGFLNVERSLIMIDSNRFMTGSVTNGNQQTHTIQVPFGVGQLKVTLCWHDIPSSPLAEKVLVNDLDMEVVNNGNIRKPLVLDHTAANINNPATEKEDRLNNTEQIVIDNPSAGNLDIVVKGFFIPSDSQSYVVAYDFLPSAIELKYPISGTQVKSNDSVYIYWDALKNAGAFSLEYSVDSGNNWNLVSNSIGEERRHYKWMVPANINSGRCLIRLSRGGEQFVSGMFIINTQPLVRVSQVQCPGYFQVNWAAIPNATAYHVMKKEGATLVTVDTVSDTSYIFKGLALDSMYYVAVAPVIDSVVGYRSKTAKRQPSDGNCEGNISDGDIMIVGVSATFSGRLFTGSELSASEVLSVEVRNLDDITQPGFDIFYSINNSAWITQSINTALPANDVTTIDIPGINLSSVGDYEVRIAVNNTFMADPVTINDTLVYYLSQLPNAPVTLDYKEDFETLTSFEALNDTSGFADGRRWDYTRSTDTGRIRSFVFPSVTINGQRSLSLDAYRPCRGNTNALTGTFNLANYNAQRDEVRIEFEYIMHGIPNAREGNLLYVRGDDAKGFRELFRYNLDREKEGDIQNSGSLSLSDMLLSNGDNFSTSTQLRFFQNDNSLIGGKEVGQGVTIDDVRMYTVQNDVQLLEVVSPAGLECGVSGSVPLVVKIRNGVFQNMNDVKVYYRLDDGAVVMENIATIEGKQTIDYSFRQLIDISRQGVHNIDVWIVANGDTYHQNDSIMGYEIRNQPLINKFPYFEDFEKNDGAWYAAGRNSSWQYGVPTAPKISKAGSGQNAWVTNLIGNYNPNELSYLYSPCFVVSGLKEPVINFKLALDIESCGMVLCDAAYMDYSIDGGEWRRLGRYGDGLNWYTDSIYQCWSIEGKTDWHVAEFALPDSGFAGNVQFRFGLATDPGSEKEGIAIDDFRIFDRQFLAPDTRIISISPNPVTDGILNIEWTSADDGIMKVTITDMLGRDIYATDVTSQQGDNRATINAPVLSTGMYFVRVKVGDKEELRKIVFRRS